MILGNPFANNFRSGLFETLLTEKVPKRVPLGGAGYAICIRLRMFYEGRPVREKVTSEAASGGHFAASGSILGALWKHFSHFGAPLAQLLSPLRFHCDSGAILVKNGLP